MSTFFSKGRLNKLVASLMVAAMFAAAFFVTSPAAKAADSGEATGSATLNGALSLAVTTSDNAFNFTDVGGPMVPGQQYSPTGQFAVQVEDSTGNHTGWKVQASVTDFTRVDGATLATGDLTVNSGDFTVTGGSPVNGKTYGTPIPLVSSATIIASSPNTTGEYQQTGIDFDLGLDILGTTKAGGTYTATLTITIAPAA